MTKVNFGKKLFNMANALAHGVRPKRYRCRFMAPGLTNYPGEDGNGEEMWYLSRDVMNKMQDSFVGCPVVAETNHDGSSTPDNFKERVKNGDYDGVVTKAWTGDDGWDWADFIIWDGDVQESIERRGYNVSCAYNTMEFSPGGVLNAVNYDHEVTEGEYIHLGIVSAPRQTGARIFLNSLDNEEGGVINFECQWEGKTAQMKLFTNGRTKLNAMDDATLKKAVIAGIENKTPLKDLVEHLKSEGNDEAKIQATIEAVMKESKGKFNVAPPGWEKTVEEMKGKPEIEEPFALAWWMKEKGYKPNEADIDKGWGEFKTNQEKEDKEKKDKEDDMKKNGIDLKNAIIETPNGDVKLQDMLNAYEAAKKNEAKSEEEKKKVLDAHNAAAEEKGLPAFENFEEYDAWEGWEDEKKNKYNALIKAGKTRANAIEELEEKKGDKKISMDDEIEGVKVSAMYEAYKKNADAEALKKKEEEEAGEKKSNERKTALKSEGKSDEEIESIMKSEAETLEEERKKKEDEEALKSAEKDAGEAKKVADEKLNHFNSLATARNKKIENPPPPRTTRRQRIQAAKTEY